MDFVDWIIFLSFMGLYVFILSNPKQRRKATIVCKKNHTTRSAFAQKVYDEMPDPIKRRVFFSDYLMPAYDGECTKFRKNIRLSTEYMIDHYTSGFKSVRENHALCLVYGHEFSHCLHPKNKILPPLTKVDSIFSVMAEVRADIEGRLFFDIGQEESVDILKRENRIRGVKEVQRYIIKCTTHPDWSDRYAYLLEYPEYNAALEERIKMDYCRKLKCPYEKVAELTLLGDNHKTQEIIKELFQ